MKTQAFGGGVLALLFLLSMTVGAAEGSGSDKDVLALGGKCPVALVDMGKEVDGKADLVSTYHGYEYRFSKAEAKKMFDAQPAKYAIQQDGACVVCAYGGKAVKGDPAIFAVHEGKIFIFPSADVRAKFAGDPNKYLGVAKKPEGSGRRHEGS
jgi:YHS domain-containing protein